MKTRFCIYCKSLPPSQHTNTNVYCSPRWWCYCEIVFPATDEYGTMIAGGRVCCCCCCCCGAVQGVVRGMRLGVDLVRALCKWVRFHGAYGPFATEGSTRMCCACLLCGETALFTLVTTVFCGAECEWIHVMEGITSHSHTNENQLWTLTKVVIGFKSWVNCHIRT